MINLNSEFLDSEVFSFLKRSFQTLHPIHWWERRILPSGLMQSEIVRVETPIWVPLIWYAQRVVEITELSSVATRQPLTYFYRRWFLRKPKAPMERTSEISVHCSTFQNAPPGRFSWPVLIQIPDQNPEQHLHHIAMVVTSVLRDLGRILECDPPEIHHESIKRFTFSANGSE